MVNCKYSSNHFSHLFFLCLIYLRMMQVTGYQYETQLQARQSILAAFRTKWCSMPTQIQDHPIFEFPKYGIWPSLFTQILNDLFKKSDLPLPPCSSIYWRDFIHWCRRQSDFSSTFAWLLFNLIPLPFSFLLLLNIWGSCGGCRAESCACPYTCKSHNGSRVHKA